MCAGFLLFSLLCCAQMYEGGVSAGPVRGAPTGGTTGQCIYKATNADYDFVWRGPVFTNNAVRPIETVAAAANGFTLSAVQCTHVSYSVTILSSSTLAVGSSGYVVLEICPTNSSVAGDWQEIARLTNGQNNGLIVGLALNQPGGAPLAGIVPAGYYVRLRSVNVVGTPTYTWNSGQEVQLL